MDNMLTDVDFPFMGYTCMFKRLYYAKSALAVMINSCPKIYSKVQFVTTFFIGINFKLMKHILKLNEEQVGNQLKLSDAINMYTYQYG